jgi:hypothetical protein
VLEHAIERLTVEVQRLREVIEQQNAIAEHDRTPPPAPESDLPGAGASFLNEQAVAALAGVSVGLLRRWRLFKAIAAVSQARAGSERVKGTAVPVGMSMAVALPYRTGR